MDAQEVASPPAMEEDGAPAVKNETVAVVETQSKEELSSENSLNAQEHKEPISVKTPPTLAADEPSTHASLQSPPLASVPDVIPPPIPSASQPPSGVEDSPSTISVEGSPSAPALTTVELSFEEKPKKKRSRAGFVEDSSDDEPELTTTVPDNDSISVDAYEPSLSGPGLEDDVSRRSVSEIPYDPAVPSVDPFLPTITLQSVMRPESDNGPFPNGTDVTAVSTTAPLSSHTENGTGPLPLKPTASLSTPASYPIQTMPKARLPHDRVGLLEDRISEDPKGDLNAWISLIEEYRSRQSFDDARAVYERFFKIFPMAAEQWVAYANLELEQNDFFRLEQIFGRTLLNIPDVPLWSLYLDYVRRRNNLTTDTAGTARTTVSQAYDFVLQNVGMDKDSGPIWQDYVAFIRSGPGTTGGGNWQDQQKMDLLRKTYQRAICVPTAAVNALWKQYDQFEMDLNRMTGRKFLQEKSPSYMTARSSYIELENITRGLQRTTMPKLPPAFGFDGEEEYMRQVELWNRWIRWERDDPLVLRDDDMPSYRARIVHVFKQAVLALRFWPEIWFDASDFCYREGLEKDGTTFMTQGMAACPESCLLAFKRGDHLEATLPADDGEEGIKRRGKAVREPYEQVLDALYDLVSRAKAREAREIARLDGVAAADDFLAAPGLRPGDEDEDEEREAERATKDVERKAAMRIVRDGANVHIHLLSRTISSAWVALMRAMRRVQGKGKVGDAIGGSRQVFTDARKRGRITSDVYIASALLEYHCYKDVAGTRIFERGMKLFPEDEHLALAYLQHLIAINDVTNARAVFETTVSRLAQKAESLHKTRPIYAFFHAFESQYGELSQIRQLEKRMTDLFPKDGPLTRFAHRYTTRDFNPTAVRPIISPATQTRPKAQTPFDTQSTASHSPRQRPGLLPYSPKRAAPTDDSDTEGSRPRKLARGESPLKGAAGRRLDQQKRLQQNYGPGPDRSAAPSWPQSHALIPAAQAAPPPLPREVLFLLSIIPGADTYAPATPFNAEAMVRLLQRTDMPTKPPPLGFRPHQGGMPQSGMYPHR